MRLSTETDETDAEKLFEFSAIAENGNFLILYNIENI